MNRMQYLREQAGWSQRELAHRLGVSGGAISKYENGRIPLSPEVLKKLVDIFDVSADFVLGLSDARERGTSYAPPTLAWDAKLLIDTVDDLPDDQRRLVLKVAKSDSARDLVSRWVGLSNRSKRHAAEYLDMLHLYDKANGFASGDDE